MDNQAAIEFLKNMIDREAIGFVCPEREGDVAIWQYHVEALQMAISVLQEQDSKTRKICDTCKHDPPSKKWPCVDCDMRDPADRWEPNECQTCKHYDDASEKCGECLELGIDNYEPKEMENSKELSKTQKALDTISRQAVIDAFYQYPNINWTTLDVLKKINDLPPAQPERKAGRWLIRKGISDAQCSECKMYFSDVYDVENSDAYCRHCGAKMEGLKVVKRG